MSQNNPAGSENGDPPASRTRSRTLRTTPLETNGTSRTESPQDVENGTNMPPREEQPESKPKRIRKKGQIQGGKGKPIKEKDHAKNRCDPLVAEPRNQGTPSRQEQIERGNNENDFPPKKRSRELFDEESVDTGNLVPLKKRSGEMFRAQRVETPDEARQSTSSNTVTKVDNIAAEYTHERVAKDGACLFNAIASIADPTGLTTAQDLRELVSAKMKTDEGAQYVNALLIEGKTVEQYSENIKKPGEWGGEIDLSILGKHYEIEWGLVSFSDSKLGVQVICGGLGFKKRGYLLYDGNHYDYMARRVNNMVIDTQFDPEFSEAAENCRDLARTFSHMKVEKNSSSLFEAMAKLADPEGSISAQELRKVVSLEVGKNEGGQYDTALLKAGKTAEIYSREILSSATWPEGDMELSILGMYATMEVGIVQISDLNYRVLCDNMGFSYRGFLLCRDRHFDFMAITTKGVATTAVFDDTRISRAEKNCLHLAHLARTQAPGAPAPTREKEYPGAPAPTREKEYCLQKVDKDGCFYNCIGKLFPGYSSEKSLRTTVANLFWNGQVNFRADDLLGFTSDEFLGKLFDFGYNYRITNAEQEILSHFLQCELAVVDALDSKIKYIYGLGQGYKDRAYLLLTELKDTRHDQHDYFFMRDGSKNDKATLFAPEDKIALQEVLALSKTYN